MSHPVFRLRPELHVDELVKASRRERILDGPDHLTRPAVRACEVAQLQRAREPTLPLPRNLPPMPAPFDPDFKASAIQMVRQHGRSIRDAADNLNISESCLRGWLKQADAAGTPADLDVQAELQRLRAENATLRIEREIIKRLGRQSSLAVRGFDAAKETFWITAEAGAADS